MANYGGWNAALADTMFGASAAFQPVFLDLEDDYLIAAAVAAGYPASITAEEAEAELVAAALQQVEFADDHPAKDAFQKVRENLRTWRASSQDPSTSPPPVLTLLSVFSRAAERMGQDKALAANNYYDRLLELLGLEPSLRPRVEQSFRRDSEDFWTALNDWLDACGGERGYPTAYSFTHRYVGIPMSQALIRAADRALLPTMFVDMALDPGVVVTPGEMVEYLREWITKRGHGTLSIKQAITSDLGRQVLAEAAITALATWGGADDQTDVTLDRRIALRASIAASLFGSPTLLFGLAVRLGLGESPGAASAWMPSTAENEAIHLSLRPDGLAYSPLPMSGADPRSLLEADLTLTEVEGERRATRRGRAIVVLTTTADGGFTESDRVRMGEEHLILVHEALRTRNGKARFAPGGVADVAAHLDKIAAPGWEKLDHTQLIDLPEGWVAFRRVVVVRHAPSPDMLEGLEVGPLTSLTASQDIAIPGRQRRVLADAPLTIRATAADIDLGVDLTQHGVGKPQIISSWRDPERSQLLIVVPSIDAGRYRLELSTPKGAKRATVQYLSFEVVSADEPRAASQEALDYGDVAVTPSCPAELSAHPAPIAPLVERSPLTQRTHTPPDTIWWRFPDAHDKALAELGPVPKDSCAITGAHHFELPYKGHQGVCEHCGLVRSFRRKPGRRMAIAQSSSLPALPQLTATQARGSDLVRALSWLRGGSIDELSQVLRSVEDTALAAHDLQRMLEALAVINVERDALMRPVAWSVAAPQAYALPSGEWLVTGAFTHAQWRALADAAESGESVRIDVTDWLPRVCLTGSVDDAAELLARTGIPEAAGSGVHLMQRLRPLSLVSADLPRFDFSGDVNAALFVVADNAWRELLSPSTPGLYRIDKNFTKSYVFRSPTDIANGTAAWVDPYLGKHLAAQLQGRLLMAHDPSSERLLLPLGAGLPGLYGRALTLASGSLPHRLPGQPTLVYDNVPVSTAAIMTALLKD